MNAIAIAPNFATEEELWQLSQDGYRYELIEGELKTMPPTGAEHGGFTSDISTEVGYFVRRNNLGRCFGAETGFRIAENPVMILAPDSALCWRAKELSSRRAASTIFGSHGPKNFRVRANS